VPVSYTTRGDSVADRFEEIVAGVEIEPVMVTLLRVGLKEDRAESDHPLIDGLVDELRVYFGDGVFDAFVATADLWPVMFDRLRGVPR
jgi:hypothetical protein